MEFCHRGAMGTEREGMVCLSGSGVVPSLVVPAAPRDTPWPSSQ